MTDENEQMVPLREYAALFKRCEALTKENTRLRDRLRREADINRRMRAIAWDIVLWTPGDEREGRDDTMA